MQKVSKQSLAMIALSILLAISIALTFTFALTAAKQKQANGTITFGGEVAILMIGYGNETANTYEFKISDVVDGDIALSSYKMGLATTSVNAYLKVTVSALTGANADSGGVTMSAIANDTEYTKSASTEFVTKTKITGGEGNAISLSDLIKIKVDLSKLTDDSNVTFTVTVNASVNTTFAA